MQTSYRKPINFTWDTLNASYTQLKRLRSFASLKPTGGVVIEVYKKEFIEALCDDLNTAKALATLGLCS